MLTRLLYKIKSLTILLFSFKFKIEVKVHHSDHTVRSRAVSDASLYITISHDGHSTLALPRLIGQALLGLQIHMAHVHAPPSPTDEMKGGGVGLSI